MSKHFIQSHIYRYRYTLQWHHISVMASLTTDNSTVCSKQFRLTTKKQSKFCITGPLCEGRIQLRFPSKSDSNGENVWHCLFKIIDTDTVQIIRGHDYLIVYSIELNTHQFRHNYGEMLIAQLHIYNNPFGHELRIIACWVMNTRAHAYQVYGCV